MIDELVLEQLLAEIAEEIAVAADGAQRVAHELAASGSPARGATPRFTHLAMAAAAVVVIVGAGALIHSATESSTKANSERHNGNGRDADIWPSGTQRKEQSGCRGPSAWTGRKRRPARPSRRR
ncbi:MAG: hypothetical protein ACLPVY_10065 [Acidimicrobiia bacterium]